MCRDVGGGVHGILGLEEDVENTTYTVVSSTNGFATESVVGEYADNVFPVWTIGTTVYVANEYGCYDTTLVTTTDLWKPFGLRLKSVLQGNGLVPDSVGAVNGLSFPVGAWASHDSATSSIGLDRRWMMWLWRVAMTVRLREPRFVPSANRHRSPSDHWLR